MAIEIFIGRNEQLMCQNYGDNVYIVAEDCSTVSSPHAKVTIYENGVWVLEDLNSKNGTYVRNDKGEFERVYNLQITPDTVIRFGVAGHMSHTCWASHIKSWYEGNKGPDSYFYEFDRMQHLAAQYNEEVSALEAKIERHNWIAMFSSAFVMIGMLVWMYFESRNSSPNKSNTQTLMVIRMMAMSMAPPLTKACFSKDPKKLKALRQKRTWLMSCPCCGMPLTDMEIDNRKCNKCKAH